MPDIWIDVDTAITIPVNKVPIVASSDGFTTDETIAYNESGMDLNWNFVTTAGVQTQTNVVPTTGGDYDWTHVGNAMYKIEMTASGGASADNDTEGFGWFSGNADAICPFSGPTIGFRAAALNNALIDGGDNLQVDVTHIMNTILTEGAGGRLAAAFIKLFDVATPVLVASDVMVGTNSAALASVLGAAVGASISADIAAVKAETASIQTETTAIDALTKAAGDGDLAAIKVITDALTAAGAAKLALGATTMITGTVSYDNTNATTTVIYSDDITEATADHFNGRLFVPTSGALLGQYTDITDYSLDTGEGKFTVTALTEPPADDTTFVIL